MTWSFGSLSQGDSAWGLLSPILCAAQDLLNSQTVLLLVAAPLACLVTCPQDATSSVLCPVVGLVRVTVLSQAEVGGAKILATVQSRSPISHVSSTNDLSSTISPVPGPYVPIHSKCP